MHPMPHSEAVEVAKRNVCAECGNPLTVAWGGSYGIDGHVVRCGRDVTHEGRRIAMAQAYHCRLRTG